MIHLPYNKKDEQAPCLTEADRIIHIFAELLLMLTYMVMDFARLIPDSGCAISAKSHFSLHNNYFVSYMVRYKFLETFFISLQSSGRMCSI